MKRDGRLGQFIRFFKKVRKTSYCWVWTGANSAGYGQIWSGGAHGVGTMRGAHVVSYELHRGPVPPGKQVLHRCDNGICVNPDHLFLGTQLDNMADKVAKNRTFKPKGELHPSAKLNARKVREIRRRAAAGEPHKVLAEEYGVSQRTISAVVLRQLWKEVA